MPRRSPEWLLIELFGHESDPTIIGQGSTAKKFVPLDRVVKSTTHRAVISMALDSIRDGSTSTKDFIQGETRYILLPLHDFAGHTLAVLVHYGNPDIPVKTPPDCGSWHFNATTGEASGSCELLDMYRASAESRRNARPMHEAFERLVGNDPVATRKLIDKQPGTTHQATETVRCDDGTLWVAHYSCRFVEESDGQILLHGVTRKVGAYEPGSNAPNPLDLAHQVARAGCQPGTYRFIIDPTTGNLIRSYDLPTESIRNIRDAIDDPDEINTIVSLLHLCAQDQVPLHDLTAMTANGQTLDLDLSPIHVDGTTAVVGIFRLPPK